MSLDKMSDKEFLTWIEEHSKLPRATFSHYMMKRLFALAKRTMPEQRLTEWVSRQQSYMQSLVDDARIGLDK